MADIPITVSLHATRGPKPGSNPCGAQIRDLLETTKVHVCARPAGHLYVDNACTVDYVHHCACGARFTMPRPDGSCSIPGERGQPICVRTATRQMCAGCPLGFGLPPDP